MTELEVIKLMGIVLLVWSIVATIVSIVLGIVLSQERFYTTKLESMIKRKTHKERL